MIHPLATLPLSARNRVSQITFHPTEPYLAVQSHDRSVEIFRVRSEEEVQKKQARRKKREKEKSKDTKRKEKESTVADDTSHADDQDTNKDISLEDLFTPYLVVRGSGKIRSFSFVDEESNSKGEVQVRILLLSP